MWDELCAIREATHIEIPEHLRRPVAIIGAGSIVEVAHLPAYRALGLDVLGIYDVDTERASRLAADHGIRTVYPDLAALVADPAVEVVDIAVYPWDQPEIAHRMLAAGKHLLCQKPLALDRSTAQALIADAETRGLSLVVNQQLRYDEGIAATKAMIDAGWIGTPTTVTFDMHIYTPWESWAWVAAAERLDLTYHTIHYLDAVRHLIGDPVWAWGTQTRVPGQAEKGEMRSISVLGYPGETRALLHTFHRNVDGDPHATFRVDGTGGSIRGTLGLLYDYPDGRPDTLEVVSTVLPTDGWVPYPVTTRWVPDAFRGPMAALMAEIGGGPPAPTRGRDNLITLHLIDALYRSSDGGERIDLDVEPGAEAPRTDPRGARDD